MVDYWFDDDWYLLMSVAGRFMANILVTTKEVIHKQNIGKDIPSIITIHVVNSNINTKLMKEDEYTVRIP